MEAAKALAAAQLELKRIRAIKVAATTAAFGLMTDPVTLTDLQGFERYERLAMSRRKAATRLLDSTDL